jgi:hypothetical protein
MAEVEPSARSLLDGLGMRIALASLLLVGCAASSQPGHVVEGDDENGMSDDGGSDDGSGSGTGSGSGSGSDDGGGSGSGSGSDDGGGSSSGSGSDDGGSGSDDGGGSGSGSGSDDGGSGSGSTSVSADGAYQVRSNIDLTVEALLPESAADLVGTLRDFNTNPARTLFDLAEDSGLPAVATIRDYLPSYVEDKLEGWINTEIDKLTINGVPVRVVSGEVVTLAEMALTQFALDSELAISTGSATHTLKTIDFTPAGIDAKFSVEAFPADIISASPTCTAANGELSIGDHGFALRYGEYMWRAFEKAHADAYGTTIRGALGTAVDCPSLANVIAQKCYAGYCVGHVTELTAICERGLDEAVQRAYDKVAELKFDAVHFASGTAQLVDADSDLVAEALASGVWSAEINAGVGLRSVPATFTATK